MLERPGFSRSDAGDTDPNRRAGRAGPEVPTGRYDADLDNLDEYRPSELPSAYVSEFDVSDLDGDVVESGAATTIMQLPPEMMMSAAEDGAFEEVSDSAVELLKWRAGPLHATAATTLPEPEATQPAMARPAPLPLPPPPIQEEDDPHIAATQPALSIAMVRAAVAREQAPRLADDIEAPTNSELILPVAVRLRAAIDEALSAVLAAQSSADDDAVAAGVHEHLARAVELLSAAQELGEEL